MCQWICCCFGTKNKKKKKELEEKKTNMRPQNDNNLNEDKNKQKSMKTKDLATDMNTKKVDFKDNENNLSEKQRQTKDNEREVNEENIVNPRDAEYLDIKKMDDKPRDGNDIKPTRSPNEESFYGKPSDSNDSKKEMSEKKKVSEWDRQSLTPSEVPDSEVTKTYILPYNGNNTTRELMVFFGYEFESQIGRGGFGLVRRVHKSDKKTGQTIQMACKEIVISQTKKDKMVKSLKSEIFILRKAKHPFIIGLFDHFIVQTPNKSMAFIFMEFADSDLNREISYGSLSNPTAKRYFAQMVTAMTYLHRLKIAHKDFKPENVLLVTNEKTALKDVRVSDFGLSQNVYKAKAGIIKSGHFGGTKGYMAPEIIKQNVYKEYRKVLPLNYDPFKSDMWALGVTLYEMLTKQLPFETTNTNTLLNNQENNIWSFPRSVRNTIDPNAEHLIRSLLEPNVDIRLDPLGVLTHPWIADEIDLSLINPIKQS